VTEFATIVFNSRSWLPPILVLIVGTGAALIWAGHRSEVTARIRLGCGLLKLAGVLTLAFCLLEPLLVGLRARPGANVFAIVADNSQSLQIKDAGRPQSRGELLRQELTKDESGWQAALAENFQVRRYSFDSRLQDLRDFGELNFDGRASALINSLRTATEFWRGQPVAGVLLFTDGNATDVSPDLAGLEGCPPIYPVVLGEDAELRDLSLDKMTVSQTAFEDAPVTVQAEVGARGFGGSKVSARLIEVATSAASWFTNQSSAGETKDVAEQQQLANGDASSLNFRFQIQPDKPGLHFYELDTRAQDEVNSPAAQSREATLVNNRRIAVVDRGQEPFRILYVGGRPNWEFKFLNRALEDDPQVKMVSLLRIARREPKFNFKSRDGESSNPLFRGFGDTNSEDVERYDQPVMIRLNTKDEFELRGGFPKTAEELFRYHAVIIGDMESDFFTHDQMVLLQQFVSERGGGLLMLGGAESFREGKYAETVIGSMLPVYLDQQVDAKVSDQWKLTLTREGWLQPWTRLRATEADEKTRLDTVPQFEVLNSVRGVKPGASVLATVSDGDNNNYPALVVQRFGAGRTAAVMIGDMWRWGMRDESMQKDLAKSWRQLVRWLVSDVPSRVAVTPEPSAGGDSAEVRLVVSAKDETFKPVDNATVQLTVRPVALFGPGAASELSKTAATNYIQLTADASPNQLGTYEATYIARDPGAYLVEAHVTQPDGQVVGQASAGWASDPSADEFRSLKPNRVFLETLAKRTGGEVLKMDALKSFVSRLPERRAPVTEPWSEPLWQKPSIFLFAFACFVVEWGVRRWKGLP
jgi:uncharacterized membrane protein